MLYPLSPKLPDKDGTFERHNTGVTPERSRRTNGSHNRGQSPLNTLPYDQNTAETNTSRRDHAPHDERQKRLQAAEGQAEVDRFVEEIQDWLDWDAEYADSLLIRNLSLITTGRLANIQEMLIVCCGDEEMKDGEYVDADRGSDHLPSRSGLMKENENLTETVRNMSRTNVILAEENRMLKAQRDRSLHTQIPSGVRLEDSIHAPTYCNALTKSANPNPITPVCKDRIHTKHTPPPQSQPTSPTQQHHKSRLVVHCTPRIDPKTIRPPGQIVCEINEALRKLSPQVPVSVCAKGMIISGASRTPIIIAGDSCTAADLEAHSALISKIVAGETPFEFAQTNADRQRFEICLDNVPLCSYLGEELTTNTIESVVATASRL